MCVEEHSLVNKISNTTDSTNVNALQVNQNVLKLEIIQMIFVHIAIQVLQIDRMKETALKMM